MFKHTGIVIFLIVNLCIIATVLFQLFQINKQVASISNNDPVCFFNGDFIQGDLSTARITNKSAMYNPLEDFSNTYINSEQAKPFHFGFVVNRNGNPEIWAWSYKTSSFWLSDKPHRPYVNIHVKCFPGEEWFADTR